MSKITSHPSGEMLLRALDGELAPEVRATLDGHLASCDRCRVLMDATRSTANAASVACLDEIEPGAPDLDRLRAQLRGRLADRSAALHQSWRFRAAVRWARMPAAAVAAAAILVVASGVALVRYSVDQRAHALRVLPAEPDALPIPSLTPGATALVSTADLCAGRGPSREEIAPAIRQAVLRDYGMEGLPDEDYELDYLITPELGGSSDRRNLWPERYGAHVWNAKVKDELEGLLPALVCRGAVDLETAQRDIAADWIAAYKKYFHTDRPVVTQARAQE